jgi:hypothetical protein
MARLCNQLARLWYKPRAHVYAIYDQVQSARASRPALAQRASAWPYYTPCDHLRGRASSFGGLSPFVTNVWLKVGFLTTFQLFLM